MGSKSAGPQTNPQQSVGQQMPMYTGQQQPQQSYQQYAQQTQQTQPMNAPQYTPQQPYQPMSATQYALNAAQYTPQQAYQQSSQQPQIYQNAPMQQYAQPQTYNAPEAAYPNIPMPMVSRVPGPPSPMVSRVPAPPPQPLTMLERYNQSLGAQAQNPTYAQQQIQDALRLLSPPAQQTGPINSLPPTTTLRHPGATMPREAEYPILSPNTAPPFTVPLPTLRHPGGDTAPPFTVPLPYNPNPVQGGLNNANMKREYDQFQNRLNQYQNSAQGKSDAIRYGFLDRPEFAQVRQAGDTLNRQQQPINPSMLMASRPMGVR